MTTDPLVRLAREHLAHERFAEAAAAFQRVLAREPEHLFALRGLGMAYLRSRDVDRALDVFKRLTALQPDDVLAQTSLSLCYKAKGMVPEAEAAAQQARILGWKRQLRDAAQRGGEHRAGPEGLR